jgi:cytochrome c-type biogenesis protein CcmF
MVFLGYVGFTVPLAFTLAVLISGRLKDPYVSIVRPWTLIAWLTLGLGTLLGARWAYVELGWGGYWAWDPVENASLLPWLTATALVHSFMLRGARMKISHIALAVATFVLCIFGTFITLSGMIRSIHAFAGSTIGPYILAFLALIIFISVALSFKRLAGLRSTEEADRLISRRSALLLTIVLLVAATATILTGTLFPPISETINVAPTPDYFNLSTAVIVGILILLMGICPFTTWKGASPGALARYLVAPFVGAVITGILLVVLGLRDPLGLLAFSICAFVALATLYQFFTGSRNHDAASDRNRFAALLSLVKRQRRRYGAYTVHLGIVFIAMGVVGSTAYKTGDRVTLEPGSTHTIGWYTIRYDELSFRSEPGMDVATASLTILQDATQVGILQPQKQFHHRTQQPVSKVAIRSTFREDLYVVLADWEESTQTISLQVMVIPLIAWVWIGGAVLFAGTVIAIWPTHSQDVASQGIEAAIKRLRQVQGEPAVEGRPR